MATASSTSPRTRTGVGGQNVEITLLNNSDYQTDKSLAEGVVASMQAIGIRVILNTVGGTNMTAIAELAASGTGRCCATAPS